MIPNVCQTGRKDYYTNKNSRSDKNRTGCQSVRDNASYGMLELPVVTGIAVVSVVIATIAAATTTIAATTTRRALFARAGLIDGQFTTINILAVQRRDGCGSRRIFHLDEGETAKAAGVTIIDHGQGLNSAKLRKQIANLILRGVKRQITYIDLLGQLKLSL